MAALARADLESLLRARKLDGTLTSSVPLTDDEVAPSGMAELDARLGGGWARGQVSEIVGVRSSGRSQVAVVSLGAATRRGELAALVDTLDAFDPQSAASAPCAPVWSHLLWIRGRPLAHTRVGRGYGNRSELDLVSAAVDRALKATALVLSAGGFGLVALDLADVPVQALERLPFTTWLRLQRLVEGRRTACVIVASEAVGRSAGGVSLKMEPAGDAGLRWQGTDDRSRLLAGVEARGRIVRARSGREGADAFALGGTGTEGVHDARG
jgi:hypothetical protein